MNVLNGYVMSKNIAYIAAAGSGKTTELVETALEKAKTERVLLLTYTTANEEEIKKKFYQRNACIPKNVTVQTWFTFLIQHGVKPYQDCLSPVFRDIDINGLILVNSMSAKYVSEKMALQHYLTDSQKIYSDKLSKFVVKCNEASHGNVINRITELFPNIYIDELQDLAGYDLDIIELLFKSKSNIILAGDPRQAIYLTHHEKKNAKYQFDKIISFLNDHSDIVKIDETTLNVSFRCNKEICEYASKLNKTFPKTISRCDEKNTKQGVFLIKISDIDKYLKDFNAVQLRYNRKVTCNDNYPVYNFGDSKGLTFDNVLIYPTKHICEWIEDHSYSLKATTRSRFYVALTRARHNVCILWEKKDCKEQDIKFWNA